MENAYWDIDCFMVFLEDNLLDVNPELLRVMVTDFLIKNPQGDIFDILRKFLYQSILGVKAKEKEIAAYNFISGLYYFDPSRSIKLKQIFPKASFQQRWRIRKRFMANLIIHLENCNPEKAAYLKKENLDISKYKTMKG